MCLAIPPTSGTCGMSLLSSVGRHRSYLPPRRATHGHSPADRALTSHRARRCCARGGACDLRAHRCCALVSEAANAFLWPTFISAPVRRDLPSSKQRVMGAAGFAVSTKHIPHRLSTPTVSVHEVRHLGVGGAPSRSDSFAGLNDPFDGHAWQLAQVPAQHARG